jgi:hypothetical protein
MPSADKSYVKDVLSIILDCSQRFEGGFLCLRYSCHASNIHALIWSLTSQSFYAFTCLHIPELNSSILAATRKYLTIKTEGN